MNQDGDKARDGLIEDIKYQCKSCYGTAFRPRKERMPRTIACVLSHVRAV